MNGLNVFNNINEAKIWAWETLPYNSAGVSVITRWDKTSTVRVQLTAGGSVVKTEKSASS